MTYKLGSPTGLMNHWGLFELSCENGRFLAIFSVFRPKIGDLWPFDPKKGSSYKLLPSVKTYSEGIVARYWEGLEKGVPTTTDDGRHVPGVKQHNREIVAAKKQEYIWINFWWSRGKSQSTRRRHKLYCERRKITQNFVRHVQPLSLWVWPWY